MGHKRFNPEDAYVLLSKERMKMLPQKEIINLLNLNISDKVADFGAGNGYFTIPIAKQIKNTVFAVDIEPRMLDMLKDRAEENDVQNIQFLVSDLEKVNLEDNSVNKILMSLVIHEVPNMGKVINEVKRVLVKGGQMVLVEWKAEQTDIGPSLNERISSSRMATFLEDNGFNIEIVNLNSTNYAVIATLK